VDDSFIEKLRSWTASLTPTDFNFKQKPFQQEKGRLEEPVEGAIQSAIRFGRLMFDKNHADYFKFQLMNTVLGGYFGSRLMTSIREDKGYTYGIGSSMSVMEDGAYFFITTEVGVDVREATIKEVYNELDRLKNELIPAEELGRVKNYMLGDFLRHADGAIAMMENFKNIHFNKLKPTYYTDFIHAIHEATAEELQALANKYFVESELTLVTAG
jgi:predicted Zn-dependent peptidase